MNEIDSQVTECTLHRTALGMADRLNQHKPKF